MENLKITNISIKLVSSIITLFLTLYIGLAKPALPITVKNLFKNSFFKLAILSLIAYNNNNDLQLSVLIALAFTLTMNLLIENEMNESFTHLEHFRNIENFINEEQSI